MMVYDIPVKVQEKQYHGAGAAFVQLNSRGEVKSIHYKPGQGVPVRPLPKTGALLFGMCSCCQFCSYGVLKRG